MKKIFSLLAAVLMAGSMMAQDGWIKFSDVQPATEVAGSTYGSEGFTLEIPATSDKATVDANSCTFGLSAEETVSFTHRLKTGGASSKAGRKFTLNIPEEGPLAIYARTSKATATDRNFVIANGSDTIVNHICLDADVVEGTSIFKPVIVENVPAGSYEVTYPVDGINFYGFELVGSDAPAAMDTVYFVNAADWAAVKFYAWGGNGESITWPGLDVEKADYQLQGKDVYFFVAEAGAYGKCIFNNNNNGAQTADLDWTPGMYYYNGSWMTREELDAPVVVDMYLKHNWAENPWTWKQMTYDAETETYLLREVYGATGCNWNTSASDTGSTWVANPTVVGNPASGDSAVFAFKNGVITITKIGEANEEPTTRFMKHNWGGAGNWTWKEMTREGETDTYTLRDIYGGTGCNWNTVGDNAGSTWVATPTLVGEPAVGDSAVFTLVEGAITITKIEGEGPGPEPTFNYYLVGTLAEGGWDADNAMPMEGDSIVRSVAAGTYEFKVLTTLGSWDNALGYSNVNAECSSEGYEQSGTNNVKVTLIADGDVKVKVVDGQICVVGSFGEAVVTSYTIAGDAALLGEAWAPAATANDMTNNEGTWTLVKTDVELTAKSYEYKVVGNHAWGVADFPAEGNNTLIIAEDATYDVTFTWVPAENSLTANAVKKGTSTGVDNAEMGGLKKMIQNGQFVIVREGKRYNALGAQF